MLLSQLFQKTVQNMIRLIKAWQNAIIGLERMALKGGTIVLKDGDRGRMNGIMVDAAQKSAAIICGWGR